MRRFFRGPTPGLRRLWEHRGEWDGALVESLCRELDLTHVVDPFQARHAWPPDFVYYRQDARRFQRLMGPGRAS